MLKKFSGNCQYSIVLVWLAIVTVCTSGAQTEPAQPPPLITTSSSIGKSYSAGVATALEALCNGSADDTVSFKAALSAAASPGGSVIVRPSPSGCHLTSSLTLPRNVSLQLAPGAAISLSPGVTVSLSDGSSIVGATHCRDTGDCPSIIRSGGTAPILSATGVPGNHVRGVTLRGFVMDGGGTSGHGIVLDYADAIHIEDIMARNGSASNALRLLDEVWDFWITGNSFVIWGDPQTPTVLLRGLSASSQITDGHWLANQFGEIGNNNPILFANGFVLQQRFIDDKFHITGVSMPYLIDWSGYRSDFIGCSFQGDSVANTGGNVRIRGADNHVVGGGFNDLNYGDGIHFIGNAGGIVAGVTFRSAGSPGPGAAVSSEKSASGHILLYGNSIYNLGTGYSFSTGSPVVTVGPSDFVGVVTAIDSSGQAVRWSDYDNAKGTQTVGGANPPPARAEPTRNPVVSLGGNEAKGSSGYQSLLLSPRYAPGGQINELLGCDVEWMCGVGSKNGPGVAHAILWGSENDANGYIAGIYSKRANTPLDESRDFLWGFTTRGDFGPANFKGQHWINQGAQSDSAGIVTLSSSGSSTIKFDKPYIATPACVATDNSGVAAVQTVPGAEFLLIRGTPNHTVSYKCEGNPR